jgi:aspartate carbamoyltransferase regulatory subunit
MIRNQKWLEHKNMAKIFCPYCEKPVSIRTSSQATKTIREVYANCDNENCLARPVFTISHSHDAQPPLSQLKTPSEYAKQFLMGLSDEERKIVLNTFKKY